MLQMRLTGATEQQIAKALSVSNALVHKEIKRRLGEVRREDKEAVDREHSLQNARYERMLLRWWPVAIAGETARSCPRCKGSGTISDNACYVCGGDGIVVDDQRAGAATDRVLKIMHQMNEIGGLIPEKPLIQINQDNRQQTLVFKVVYDSDETLSNKSL